jgi:hypothetical protein
LRDEQARLLCRFRRFGSPSTVAVTFDGASVGTLPLDPIAHAGAFTASPQLSYYTNDIVGAGSVFYDNFAVDIP